jgi:cell division protein FtsW (lipid II flippase)
MGRYKKIVEWVSFLFFLFSQLMVLGYLLFLSIFIKKWLDEHMPQSAYANPIQWCFEDGATPYLTVAGILVIAAVALKILEKHFSTAFILIPLGILFVCIATYIEAIAVILEPWQSLLDRH